MMIRRSGVVVGMASVLVGCTSTPQAQCRERQREVLPNLDAIAVAEQAYMLANPKPTSSLNELGVLINGTNYRYAITVIDNDHFVIEATGVGAQQGDVWRASDTVRAVNTTPLCPITP